MAKTALVVDDSKSARFALRKYLEAHQFQVSAVESAEEAYSHLQAQTPDVIFLDHMMPGTDGFEALSQIKRDARTAQIPVVICSSNEGDAFVQDSRARGAADILQKPPSPDQLQRILQTLPIAVTPEPQTQRLSASPQIPPAAPSKVANIREPEVAIEQAVMKVLRGAMPGTRTEPSLQQPPMMPEPSTITQRLQANAPVAPVFNPSATGTYQVSPPPAPPQAPAFNPNATGSFNAPSQAPAYNPNSTGSFNAPQQVPAFNPAATGNFNAAQLAAGSLAAVRDQIEARVKKLTQDLFTQMGELRAEVSGLESQLGHQAERLNEMEPQQQHAIHNALESVQAHVQSLEQGMQSRIHGLELSVQSQLRTMYNQLESQLAQQSQNLELLAQGARAAAAEEAHAVAERVVMSAASRIADTMAHSILRAFHRPGQEEDMPRTADQAFRAP